MAKVAAKKKRAQISLSRTNYVLFGVSVLVLLVGYYVLSQGPVDGFLSLTLAPLILVIGYCVLIPLAIMYSGKREESKK